LGRPVRRRALIQFGIAAGLFAPAIARAQSVIVLRWADNAAPAHPSALSALRAAAEVKEKSGGRIEIQSFPSGQLGGSRDTVEAVSSGALTMVTEGAATLGQFVPPFTIMEAPYVWKDAAHITRFLRSPAMEELNQLSIKTRDTRVLAADYYGTRHLTTGAREVHTAADMKRFKLRVPAVDVYKAMAEAWDARPTPIDYNELYLALSQGAVDGQENPLPTIQAGKFFEVQKYLVLTAHIITPRLVMINEPAWAKLSAGDQQIVTTALNNAIAWQDAEIMRQEASLAGTFKTAGMTVIQPDVETFRKPVLATLPAMFEAKWGKGLWDKIQAA
jgi:tripartite ATP-independent transporter DctP family solute receptor